MPRSGVEDALSVLQSDHERVKQLLAKLLGTTPRAAKTREKLVGEIEKELLAHARIEEEIFYPRFREAAEKGDEALFFEAKEEHHVVELVLPELKQVDPHSPGFAAKALVLQELVEHHVREEEQEMFPRAKELFSQEELQALGEQLKNRKQELVRDGGKRGSRRQPAPDIRMDVH